MYIFMVVSLISSNIELVTESETASIKSISNYAAGSHVIKTVKKFLNQHSSNNYDFTIVIKRNVDLFWGLFNRSNWIGRRFLRKYIFAHSTRHWSTIAITRLDYCLEWNLRSESAHFSRQFDADQMLSKKNKFAWFLEYRRGTRLSLSVMRVKRRFKHRTVSCSNSLHTEIFLIGRGRIVDEFSRVQLFYPCGGTAVPRRA